MSSSVKRLLCSLLALLMVTGLFAFSLEAAARSDLIYLFINDTLVKGMTSSNMPVRINNSMYISYRYLINIKPLKYFYDEDIRILKVYTSNTSLIFDVGNSITYDQNGRIYSYLAEARNGVLFIPVEFICRFFGVSYTQFPTDLGQVIRINSNLSTYTDTQLITGNRAAMQDIYDDYYPSEAKPVDPVTPPVVTDPQEIIRPRNIYPMICGPLNEYSAGLLNAMDGYGTRATFFLSSEGLASQGDQLRRLACSGYGLGLYVSSEAPLAEAEAANALLYSMIFRKTRLVCIREGSTALTADQREGLAAAGYRIWDGILDPGSADRSGYTVGVNGKNLLQNTESNSTLMLHTTASARDSIYTLLHYMQDNRFTTLTIGDWTTPVNQIKQYN